MERVAFLVEKSGDRYSCMLNPASLVMRRRSGVQPRLSSQGPVSGGTAADDPLLFAGGGVTELLLDLLFDVSLQDAESSSGSAPASASGTATGGALGDSTTDVRDLTRPLVGLSEGKTDDDGAASIPLVRFVWGKAWNLLGVVTAVSERLEYFSAGGSPQRSWLRMRLVRVPDPKQDDVALDPDAKIPELDDSVQPDDDDLEVFSVPGDGGGDSDEDEDNDSGGGTMRLDEIANQSYGDPSWWRLIASFNGVTDPLNLEPGQTLRIPPKGSA
ncbi:MAG TPA: hypothetical protein VMR25_01620 [Planctomycetaceae bacterium]|jgi:hypothetical protein|nr:hypothetical protein [Planctomycetaceae bacterium]